jgi:hypothetical protein
MKRFCVFSLILITTYNIILKTTSVLKYFEKLLEYIDYSSLRNRIETVMFKTFKFNLMHTI